MRIGNVASFTAAVFVAALLGGPVYAEGFKTHDLTTVEADVVAAFGNEFDHWAVPTTINLSCCESTDAQIIMVDIDRHTDELRQESRTDETYISTLEDICTNNGLPCEIETVDVGSAFGRIISMPVGGGMKGTNVILVKDGDRLTIRSAAKDAAIARKNAETALGVLGASLLRRD